jgi:acetolactate decarboxylase
MKTSVKIFILLMMFVVLLTGCRDGNNDSSSSRKDVLFQVSTITSLLEGNYDGFVSVGELKSNGDFGIGTFNALDGEMVMIDSRVYKIKSTSEIVEVPDTEMTPFAAVTYFDRDETHELVNIESLDALQKELDKIIVNKNKFYVFRIDGIFNNIQARSVPIQQKPYPILSEAVKAQAVFNYSNIAGSLVGVWCPDDVGGVNVPGYHFHFISQDHTKGGHLLDVSFKKAESFVDPTDEFFMIVSPTTADVTVDNMTNEIDKVEK